MTGSVKRNPRKDMIFNMEPKIEVKRVFDDVFSFEEEGVRSFLVLGSKQGILIDTGYGRINFLDEIKKITDLPIVLVNTHSDTDHIGGNRQFSSCTYAHELEIPRLKERRAEDGAEYIPVQDGYIFKLGGLELEVIHTPGHTAGCIALIDRANKRLFSNDSVSMAPVFMFGEHRDIQSFMQSLEKLKEMNQEVNVILPNHGPCPLNDLSGICSDILMACKNYLNGEKETRIVTLPFEPPVSVKVYAYGNAKILAEKV